MNKASNKTPSKPVSPLVFDDTSKGSDAFSSEGDREVSVMEQLAFERKGHVCIRGILTQDEATEMVSGLIKETKARQLEAFRHRVSVLCPGYDPSLVNSPADAMAILEAHSDEEVGFLQTFNLHRPPATTAARGGSGPPQTAAVRGGNAIAKQSDAGAGVGAGGEAASSNKVGCLRMTRERIIFSVSIISL